MSQIILKEAQVPQYVRLVQMSSLHPCILDTSGTGSGKSILASLFSLQCGATNGLLVCPTLIEPDWRNRIAEYRLPISEVISFQSLRGTCECQPKHKLLYRDQSGNFQPTPYFCSMVEDGYILILDEIMYIKNPCDQTNAVKALASYITRRMTTQPYPARRSYIYCISSSPFDSEESCIQYFITMGIISNPKLYDKSISTPLGANDLFRYAAHFNPKELEYILSHNEVSGKTIVNICYKICTDILLPIMSSSIVNPEEKRTAKQSIYYGYFDIPSEAHELIKLGISMIHKSMKKKKVLPVESVELTNVVNPTTTATTTMPNSINSTFPSNSTLTDSVKLKNDNDVLVELSKFTELNISSSKDEFDLEYNSSSFIEEKSNSDNSANSANSDDINDTKNGISPHLKEALKNILITRGITDVDKMGGITHGMIVIQSVKSLYILVSLVQKIFETVPNVKIPLFFDNKNPLRIAHQGLAQFGPVDITGDTSKEDRKNIIAKFQEPNLKSRLLLLTIGEAGIEIDDTDGNFPRIGIGMPGFGMCKMLQIPGRINRENTKSNSLFFWIYSKSEDYCEHSVINSITRKSKILSDTLNNGIVAPNMYPKIEEPAIYDFNELLNNAGTNKPIAKEEPVKRKQIIYIKSSTPSIF